jgi:hypothetical protein
VPRRLAEELYEPSRHCAVAPAGASGFALVAFDDVEALLSVGGRQTLHGVYRAAASFSDMAIELCARYRQPAR